MSKPKQTVIEYKEEECSGVCNTCTLESCPYDTPLTVAEYNLARELDKDIIRDREQKPMSDVKNIANRLDKEAYERERNRRLEHAKYWRDPDKHRKKSLNRYYKNRDRVLKRMKGYYQGNKEEILAKQREWYDTNKEELNLKKRENRKSVKELWKSMELKEFYISNGTKHELLVFSQKSINFPATNIGYRISKVVDTKSTPESIGKTGVKFRYKYVYEEVNLQTDAVVYSSFIGIDTIKNNHKWFLVEEV